MSLQVFKIVRKFRQFEFETQSKSYWYLVNKVDWEINFMFTEVLFLKQNSA